MIVQLDIGSALGGLVNVGVAGCVGMLVVTVCEDVVEVALGEDGVVVVWGFCVALGVVVVTGVWLYGWEGLWLIYPTNPISRSTRPITTPNNISMGLLILPLANKFINFLSL